MKKFKFTYIWDQVRRTKTIQAVTEDEAWIIFRNHQVEGAEQIKCKECKSSIRRDGLLRDLGLTKVKGALGGTYWE